jgi:hypothetical protein
MMKKKLWIILISALIAAVLIPVIFVVSVYSGAFGHMQTKE